MSEAVNRSNVLPEPALPRTVELAAEGRALAREARLGDCAFFRHYGVTCEAQYKRARAAAGEVMLHAHVGYRDVERTIRACAEIWEALDRAGFRLDRIGVQFDHVMGYPGPLRKGRLRGTGMILEDYEPLARLTASAPAAFHFGDFVLGFPAAIENASAALAAGATSIGNLGQYWGYRLADWGDDVGLTADLVKAIAMLAAQPVEVIVHSNLNDGMAALFADLACAVGGVMLERYIVEDLLGARIGHCYGHNFSEPLSRLAMQRAIARVGGGPGTMVYGNTTGYRQGDYRERVTPNYATLGTYLLVDVVGQRTRPTGHAVNPVPVTEFERIPDVEEIVDAHLFANRLIERAEPFERFLDLEAAEAMADRLVEGGTRFRDAVLAGFAEGGVDTGDAMELLLALRRTGARRLEALYGPGAEEESAPRGRRAVVAAPIMVELEGAGARVLAGMEEGLHERIRGRGLVGCVAGTDVHEYGKMLVERVLGELGVTLVDAGTDATPRRVAEAARDGKADFVALSSYNGVAYNYIRLLREAMRELGLDIPVYIGGRLNEIPDSSNTSLPVDVSTRVREAGAVPCTRVEDMLLELAGEGAA